ncbi:MAG: response regulator [Bacteroidota bacterium]
MSSDFRLQKNNKILVVDDNNVNQLLINKMLTSVGANITSAFDGREAVELAFRNDYDLIIMDIQMPILNGYEATQTLRKRGFDKPILALSADFTNEDIIKCQKVGMNDFLQKPFPKKKLISLLKKWMSTEPGFKKS